MRIQKSRFLICVQRKPRELQKNNVKLGILVFTSHRLRHFSSLAIALTTCKNLPSYIFQLLQIGKFLPTVLFVTRLFTRIM